MITPRPDESFADFIDRATDDVETCRELVRMAVDDDFAHGVPVFQYDKKGLYQLFQDGKKYVKYY